MKPEKQRVQRVLSALINLYKFRAEKLAWYEENMQKKVRRGWDRGASFHTSLPAHPCFLPSRPLHLQQASITRKQELAAQIEHLRQAIAAEA